MSITTRRLPGTRWYEIDDPDYPGTLDVAIGPAPSPQPLALGAWLGWHGPDWNHNQAATYRAMVGEDAAIIQWYQSLANSPAWDVDRNVSLLPAGVLPLITFELCDVNNRLQTAYNNAAILSGKYDATISAFAKGCAAYGKPTLIRLGHEGTGVWQAWSCGPGNPMGNTPESYIAMWRHVVRLFRAAGAGNARFVFCPQVTTAGAVGYLAPMADCYPGPAYVDYLGLDGYCWGNSGGSNGPWKSFYDVFAADYATITTLGTQDLLICETGCVEGDGGDKANWLQDMAASAHYWFPRLRAIVLFARLFGTHDWRIDSSPAALAAFQQIARQPLMQGTLG